MKFMRGETPQVDLGDMQSAIAGLTTKVDTIHTHLTQNAPDTSVQKTLTHYLPHLSSYSIHTSKAVQTIQKKQDTLSIEFQQGLQDMLSKISAVHILLQQANDQVNSTMQTATDHKSLAELHTQQLRSQQSHLQDTSGKMQGVLDAQSSISEVMQRLEMRLSDILEMQVAHADVIKKQNRLLIDQMDYFDQMIRLLLDRSKNAN